jgi:hypothetical protein
MGKKVLYKVSEEIFREAIANSYSIASALNYMGMNEAGANYRGFHKRVKELGIDISHFTGQAHLKGQTHSWGRKIPLEDILVKDSDYTSTDRLKKRLLKSKLLTYKCKICKIKTWCDKPLSLHLDHINGDQYDNRLENLRLLCPNCHSQTDTFAGRNKGKTRNKPIINRDAVIYNRPKREYKFVILNNHKHKQCDGCKLYYNPRNPQQRYCSYECTFKSNRRVERPPKEELEQKLKNGESFLGMSRDYGVSDQAIRKWCISYGIDYKSLSKYSHNNGHK